MEATSTSLKEIDDVQAVLMRPMMYTAQGSFFEVLAFLQGYHAGHHLPKASWHSFPVWLQEHFGFTLTQLREGHDDDPAAIRQLLKLYNEFLASQTEHLSP